MSKANSTARKAPSSGAASGSIGKPKSAAAKSSKQKCTKIDAVIQLLSRPEGATVVDLAEATGWQQHTVRGVISRPLAKERDYKTASSKTGDSQYRRYKITGTVKIKGGGGRG